MKVLDKGQVRDSHFVPCKEVSSPTRDKTTNKDIKKGTLLMTPQLLYRDQMVQRVHCSEVVSTMDQLGRQSGTVLYREVIYLTAQIVWKLSCTDSYID